jgi:hypothetical protein
LKKAAEVCRKCSVVIKRLTPAQIDEAMYASVKKIITMRMGTGGVAPRKKLWVSSKLKMNRE